MTDRARLLRRLSAHQFAIWELHLYLDTHYNDKNALRMLECHLDDFNKLKAEYEKLYGPLDHAAGSGSPWLADPWPWDLEGDDC